MERSPAVKSCFEAVASWSGGKDSCLAAYLALRQGCRVRRLLNIAAPNDDRVAFQGIPCGVVDLQGRAIGVPVLRERFGRLDDRDANTEQTAQLLARLRAEGIDALVSGHISRDDVQRDQLIEACRKSGMRLIEPLAGCEREHVLEQFFSAGFRAVIAKVARRALGSEWLGRPLDRQFVAFLKTKKGVDLCGDLGEYHSLVVDGPMFSGPLSFDSGSVFEEGDSLVLAMSNWRLGPRRPVKNNS